MTDDLLTPVQLAELVGVPRSTVYTWRYHGTGPRAIKVGRHIRFRRSDVDAWLEANSDPKDSDTPDDWFLS